MLHQGSAKRVSTAGIACRGDRFLVALRRPGTSIGESWEFPGGKQQENESPRKALKREFYEEFSVDIVVGEKIFTGSFSNRDMDYTLEAYKVRLLNDTFILKEHRAVRWVTLKDLKHLPMANSDRQILHFLEKNTCEKQF